MSAPVDTSGEAVEAIARALEQSVSMPVPAALLRALLRERDEARAERDTARGWVHTWSDACRNAETLRLQQQEEHKAALATARADALRDVKQCLEMTYAIGNEREAPGIERAMRRVQQLIEKEPRA